MTRSGTVPITEKQEKGHIWIQTGATHTTSFCEIYEYALRLHLEVGMFGNAVYLVVGMFAGF